MCVALSLCIYTIISRATHMDRRHVVAARARFRRSFRALVLLCWFLPYTLKEQLTRELY